MVTAPQQEQEILLFNRYKLLLLGSLERALEAVYLSSLKGNFYGFAGDIAQSYNTNHVMYKGVPVALYSHMEDVPPEYTVTFKVEDLNKDHREEFVAHQTMLTASKYNVSILSTFLAKIVTQCSSEASMNVSLLRELIPNAIMSRLHDNLQIEHTEFDQGIADLRVVKEFKQKHRKSYAKLEDYILSADLENL